MNEQNHDIEYEFTARLRSETLTQDWMVDWRNAPPSFKTYAAKHTVRLYSDISAKPERGDSALYRISQLFFYSAGCLRVRRYIHGQPRVRRAVASGGGLYPGELYFYTYPCGDLSGLCHYNPARHELAELRKCRMDDLIADALRIPRSEFNGRAVLIITNYFWKSYFKYADFSYRLGAVDVGVLVGRLMRIGAQLFGEAAIHFDFDDRSLNHLLGIDGTEESAYAALTLGPASESEWADTQYHSPSDLPPPPCAVPYSTPARRSAEFEYMHRSSLEGNGTSVPVKSRGPILAPQRSKSTLALPDAVDLGKRLYSAIQSRASDGPSFAPRVLECEVLATCLREGVTGFEQLRSNEIEWPSPQLYCAVLRVQGVPEGLYRYDAQSNALELIKTGSFGAALQKAMRLDNINVELAACVIHFVDLLDWRKANRGCRAYRIQQMFIGSGLDGVMLAAAHFNVTAHPLLGFRAQQIDRLYDLPGMSEGSLAQICIGHKRRGAFLETPVVI